MAQKEIPCYLFVGMLESGKTKFIQETMEDPQFDSGDKTLLLICEEGEEEYDSERFAFGGVTVATIEDKAELNREHLQQLAEKSDCGRVIIEYNGMWLVQELPFRKRKLELRTSADFQPELLVFHFGDHADSALPVGPAAAGFYW